MSEKKNKINKPMKHHNVFVNRTLNMKKITHIGLDMDLTLVRYNSLAFEGLTHKEVIRDLIEKKNYPEEIRGLKIDFSRAIRGLVIDKKNGNLLKISRFGAIRIACHGLTPLTFSELKKTYRSHYISIGDSNYEVVDTHFSLTLSILFAQLVTLKDTTLQKKLPDYEILAKDIIETLDQAHSTGNLKQKVIENMEKYVIKDPEVVEGLERYILHNKKIFIITNSLPDYTIEVLNFAIQPFLKKHKHWLDLFEVVISNAQKPKFFFEERDFVKYDIHSKKKTPMKGRIDSHCFYDGGSAKIFTQKMNLEPDQVLYIGDHIYSDVVRIKKDSGWRTALVVEELDSEIQKYKKFSHTQKKIDKLMKDKIPLERKIDELISKDIEAQNKAHKKKIENLLLKIRKVDSTIQPLIQEGFMVFNPYWGETFRTGQEETFFTHQIERFACIYTSKLKEFLKTSPRTYFRSQKRPMPHERSFLT